MSRRRLPALTLLGLLASTTLALAASGVIRIGSAVPAYHHLHRDSGLGVPLRAGATRLLPLRVADPHGGPPWGIRVVRTSRQAVCLQLGRVAHGRFGELGIDGAFHDDGELHPRPASALLSAGDGVLPYVSDSNTHCGAAGEAMTVADLLVPSSAVPLNVGGPRSMSALEALPRRDLRDVYFGLLGPQAVSVTYRQDGAQRTEAVAPGSGVYLIVRPLGPGQSLRDFGGASGSAYGQLSPGPGELVTKVTYRIHGRLCERGLQWVRTPVGAWRSKGTAADVARPCPQPREPRQPFEHPIELHRPLHADVRVEAGAVTGLTISFRAPYAVTGVQEEYSLLLPQRPCHVPRGDVEVEGGDSIPLDRNVRAGAVLSYTIPHPFAVRRICRRRTLIVKAVYQQSQGARPRTIVGEVTVRQPPGTRGR